MGVAAGMVRDFSRAELRAMAPRTPRDTKRKRDAVTQILPKSNSEEKAAVQQDFPRGRPEGDKVRRLEPTPNQHRGDGERTWKWTDGCDAERENKKHVVCEWRRED